MAVKQTRTEKFYLSEFLGESGGGNKKEMACIGFSVGRDIHENKNYFLAFQTDDYFFGPVECDHVENCFRVQSFGINHFSGVLDDCQVFEDRNDIINRIKEYFTMQRIYQVVSTYDIADVKKSYHNYICRVEILSDISAGGRYSCKIFRRRDIVFTTSQCQEQCEESFWVLKYDGTAPENNIYFPTEESAYKFAMEKWKDQ